MAPIWGGAGILAGGMTAVCTGAVQGSARGTAGAKACCGIGIPGNGTGAGMGMVGMGAGTGTARGAMAIGANMGRVGSPAGNS
jgi:hypothetical protein